MCGLGDRAEVTRGGIRWELDLTEGIDLAIYLDAYQRIPKRLVEEIIRPGTIALDIGANIGAFTLPLAVCVGDRGRVFAFEATHYACRKLRRNITLNPGLAPRIELRQVVFVASDDAAVPPAIYSSWSLEANAHDRHPRHGGIAASVDGAIGTTLDMLMLSDATLFAAAPRVGFVKLDVDGNEVDVLRGGRTFFGKWRPPILLEMAPYVQDEKPGRLQGLLDEVGHLGYRLEVPDTKVRISLTAAAIRRLIPDGCGIDLLCLPARAATSVA